VENNNSSINAPMMTYTYYLSQAIFAKLNTKS